MRETGKWFDTEWECPAPDEGVRFTVTEQEWDEDYKVRTIREISLVGATFG